MVDGLMSAHDPLRTLTSLAAEVRWALVAMIRSRGR